MAAWYDGGVSGARGDGDAVQRRGRRAEPSPGLLLLGMGSTWPRAPRKPVGATSSAEACHECVAIVEEVSAALAAPTASPRVAAMEAMSTLAMDDRIPVIAAPTAAATGQASADGVAAETWLIGWLRHLSHSAEACHDTADAAALLMLADRIEKSVPSPSTQRLLANTLRERRLPERKRPAPPCACALASIQKRLDKQRRACELKAEAVGGLLLQRVLPALSVRISPVLLTFQTQHPQAAPGACACFAPHHFICASCRSRRDGLNALLPSLDAHLLATLDGPLTAAAAAPPTAGTESPSPSSSLHGAYVADHSSGGEGGPPTGGGAASMAAVGGQGARIGGGGGGARRKSTGGVGVGSGSGSGRGGAVDDGRASSGAARDSPVLGAVRPHLRQLLTRQLYHSLYASSQHDAAVRSHLTSLQPLQPSALGVPKVLCLPGLWASAVQQLLPLDDMRTPTDVLRVITRTWDSLLGVLGVWSRHAQADDFMPLMAWIVIQAAPTRLVSQLHFLHNHIGDLLLSRQEMWLAHFTAACEVACRLSGTVGADGLAVSLPESTCCRRRRHPATSTVAAAAAARAQAACVRRQREGAPRACSWGGIGSSAAGHGRRPRATAAQRRAAHRRPAMSARRRRRHGAAGRDAARAAEATARAPQWPWLDGPGAAGSAGLTARARRRSSWGRRWSRWRRHRSFAGRSRRRPVNVTGRR